MREGLDTIVDEGGNNFSAGERQKLCLARALLKKSRFLFLDECSSSVDQKSDFLIQKVLRTCDEFKDATVLTIAHRLSTVADYDRILVMSNGEVAEFDTSLNLLNNESSLFYQMVAKGGENALNEMKRIAVEHEENKKQKQ